MSLSDEQWEFLQDIARLIIEGKGFGYKLTGGELYRTKEQQEIHFNAGRSLTMVSMHRKRCAIDFNVFIKNDKGKWELTYSRNKIKSLGEFWKSLYPEKNIWGGDFKNLKDTGHFERKI